MAVTDPRIFAQSVGLGNLPQLYATNIQAPDISPIQRAQQLSMQEQQFSTSLAMRQQEFKQKERAFELDEIEQRLAFDDKLGAKFLSADMPTVQKVMDEIGLSQALDGPLKASEIVPLYKQFHQDERIQALTAKKALTDNLLNYAKENKDVLGRNATAYRSQVLSTASNPDATVQDLASIDPRVFDYYDYRGLIEDQIAKNKDLTADEKRQAIRNFITADPQARRQLLLDGTVREGDTVDDIVDRLSSIYAVSGRDTAGKGKESTTSNVEFKGAYSSTGESYISEANRQKAASIVSGSGSTKEERLQPMESAKTFLFDNLRNNKDWIEDQVSKVDIDRPFARDKEGFLSFEGTPPSREELAQADKTVERIDGNIYIKVNTDAGTVYYDAGPDTQLVEDNSPETKSDNLVNEFAKRRESYRDDNSAEKFGKDFNTHVEAVKRFKEDLGRNPTLEEIEQIFGERSEITEMYKNAYESAGEAIDRSSTVERPSSQFNVPSTSEAMAPQDRSPLTGQPYDPYAGIGTGAYSGPTPLQSEDRIPDTAPVLPPPTVRENINTTLDESEDEEGIVPAPAIPVERAKELVENEEDVPIIDEVIRSVGSMSQSTIDGIKEVTGVDLGELIAQGPPTPAQTPPRAIELGSTSPGGGGGGGGWGEPEAPPPPPVERAKELVEVEEDIPIIDKLVEDARAMSKGTIDAIKEVTGIDLGEIMSPRPPRVAPGRPTTDTTTAPEESVEETVERIVGPATDLNEVDLGMDSISIRANNPLNITDKGFGESHIIGSEAPADGDANITKFDSVEVGIAAFYAKVNYHLAGKGWGSPDMGIRYWQEKFATSPHAWSNFVDSANRLFKVEITEEDTLASAIEKLGGMAGFTEVMSRKENHKLYPKLKEMGIFEKVTQDNYKEYLN